MRLRLTLFIAMALLTGCNNEAVFEEQFSKLLCERSNECLRALELETMDCTPRFFGDYGNYQPDCEFDDMLAKQCLDALDSTECDGAAAAVPMSCGQVYTNCSG